MPREMKVIRHMDIAKAMGIYTIVLGHSFLETSTSQVRSFVYLFHVPLFYFISGYFFKEEHLKNPILFLKKRLKSLYIPFIKYEIIFIFLHNLFYKLNIYSSYTSYRGSGDSFFTLHDVFINLFNAFLFKGTERLLGGFWFLTSLFFVTCIFYGISFFSRNIIIKNKNIVMLPIVIALFIFGNLFFYYNRYIPLLPWDFRLFFVILPVYYLGNLYRKYENRIPLKIYYAILAFMILVIINKINYVKIDSVYSVVGGIEKPVIYLILSPLAGCYFIIYMSKVLSLTIISDFLQYIGKNTIIILALHFLCFKVVILAQIIRYGYPSNRLSSFPVIESGYWFILYSSIGVCLPVLISLVLNKIKSKYKAEIELKGNAVKC